MNRNMNQRMAALFERLGLLLGRGVPMLKALETLAGELETPERDMLTVMAGLIKTGDSFEMSLKRLECLPEDLLALIHRAETAGKLDTELPVLAGQITMDVFKISEPETLETLLEALDTGYQEILKLTNRLIISAAEAHASDLHLEPEEESGGRVRFRIDGVLKLQPDRLTSSEYPAVVSRIKEMAALDVGEHKRPQDGRIKIRMRGSDDVPGRNLDLRVSVCPFVTGEKMVLRFLDRTAFPMSIEDIRISEDKIGIMRRWMTSPFGMILVSGPTGSGKTTTLYLLIRELAGRDNINVMTVEDPVEFLLPNVFQMQINPSAGLTYAAAVRSLMRQDPDVISVGEIRDPDTASLLVQAAQTGHLTLSQLHARSAVATIKLMYDLGVPAHILREIITGVISQRLVRRLCANCKQPVSSEAREGMPDILRNFDGVIYENVGCEACYHTGYRGRDVIMELLEPNGEFWRLLGEDASEQTLARALPAGYRTLRDDGLMRIMEGVTGLNEVDRVIGALVAG